MSKYSTVALSALAAASVLSLVQVSPARAADDKTISVAACVPRGPGTTASELVFGGNGIYNPGTQNEQIICPLPRDGEEGWVQADATDSRVLIGFKTGAVPGKVACVVYVGSPADAGAGGALSSVSLTPATEPANTTGYASVDHVSDPMGANADQAVANVQCTITPKTTLAFINLEEYQDTDDDGL